MVQPGQNQVAGMCFCVSPLALPDVTILSRRKPKRSLRPCAECQQMGRRRMRRAIVLLSASLVTLSTIGFSSAQNATPRNLILFIPDGLRGRIVTPQTAPTMAALRDKGVNF